MTQSLHQQRVNDLKAEIIFQRAQYDQAIKDGKLLKETKKMFKEIRAMEGKLQSLVETKDQLVKETSK